MFSLTVLASPGAVQANAADTSVLTVRVTDSSNALAPPNVPVSFGAISGSITAGGATDASGEVTADLTSGLTLEENVAVIVTPGEPILAGQDLAVVTSDAVANIATVTLLSAVDFNRSGVRDGDRIAITISDDGLVPVQHSTQIHTVIAVSVDGAQLQVSPAISQPVASTSDFTIARVIGFATVDFVAALAEVATVELVAQAILLPIQPVDPVTDGQTQVTATVTDADDNSVAGRAVNFLVSGFGSIVGFDEVTDVNGIARATYQTGTTPNVDTVSATVDGVEGTVSVTAAGGPVFVNFVEITDTVITVQGTGLTENATLTFEVLDQNGNSIVLPVELEYTLQDGGLGGGESLSPGAGTGGDDGVPTINGVARTTLRAGTKAGVVRIIAFVDTLNDNGIPDPGEPQGFSVALTITGTPPDGEKMIFTPGTKNVQGLLPGSGDPDVDLTLRVSDFFLNPVPDGTAIFFTTDFGSVGGDALTAEEDDSTSVATTTFSIQNPKPFSTEGLTIVKAVTQSGAFARVRAIAIDPISASTIFVGTDGGGVFRSLDDGESWRQVGTPDNGLFNGNINDIAIDPVDTQIIYVATDRGFFRSGNRGDAWTKISSELTIRNEDLSLNQIADQGNLTGSGIDPLFNNAVDFDGAYAVTFPLDFRPRQLRSRTRVIVNGVENFNYNFISDPQGRTRIMFMSQTFNANAEVVVSYDIEGIPDITERVEAEDFRITAIALARQTDKDSDGTLEPDVAADLGLIEGGGEAQLETFTPLFDRTIFIAVDGLGVFRSSVVSPDAFGEAADAPPLRRRLSSGGGLSWSLVNRELQFTDLRIISLAVDRDNANRLFAGTHGDVTVAGFYRTTNAMTGVPIWELANGSTGSNLQSTHINCIEIDPIDSARIYVGTGNFLEGGLGFGVQFTTDRGDTWNQPTTNVFNPTSADPFVRNNRNVPDIVAVGVDNTAGNTVVYASTFGDNTTGGVFVSRDAGNNFALDSVGLISSLTRPLATFAGAENNVDGAEQVNVWVGASGRIVFKAIDSPNAPIPLAFDVKRGSAPNDLTNSVFQTARLLQTGNTQVRVTNFSSASLGQGAFEFLAPGDTLTFRTSVSDDFGNNLVAGTTVDAATGNGAVVDETSVELGDEDQAIPRFSNRHNTDFVFSLTSDAPDDQLSADVTVDAAGDNGGAQRAVSVVHTPDISVAPDAPQVASGGTVRLTASGGGVGQVFKQIFQVPGFDVIETSFFATWTVLDDTASGVITGADFNGDGDVDDAGEQTGLNAKAVPLSGFGSNPNVLNPGGGDFIRALGARAIDLEVTGEQGDSMNAEARDIIGNTSASSEISIP